MHACCKSWWCFIMRVTIFTLLLTVALVSPLYCELKRKTITWFIAWLTAPGYWLQTCARISLLWWHLRMLLDVVLAWSSSYEMSCRGCTPSPAPCISMSTPVCLLALHCSLMLQVKGIPVWWQTLLEVHSSGSASWIKLQSVSSQSA